MPDQTKTVEIKKLLGSKTICQEEKNFAPKTKQTGLKNLFKVLRLNINTI